MDSLHYILFNNVKEATAAYEYLKEKGSEIRLLWKLPEEFLRQTSKDMQKQG